MRREKDNINTKTTAAPGTPREEDNFNAEGAKETQSMQTISNASLGPTMAAGHPQDNLSQDSYTR